MFIDLMYEELSPLAKKYVNKCHNSTLLSPLEACRALQDGEKNLNKLSALYEAERYLINE